MIKQPVGLIINQASLVCLDCGEHIRDHELVDATQVAYSDGYPDGFTCDDCCKTIQPNKETAQ